MINKNRALGMAALVTSLFFVWGFSTVLNDTLVPKFKSLFALSYAEVMLTQFCFFLAYFLMSYPAGKILSKLGYIRSVVAGLLVMALGCVMFLPSARFGFYPGFLLALFIVASGITLLQVAANPLMTLLGAPETASSRLNLAQAFNSLGTTVGPLIGAALILKTGNDVTPDPLTASPAVLAAFRSTEASATLPLYLTIAVLLLLLAGVFWLTRRTPMPGTQAATPLGFGVLRNRQLAFGCVSIFTYVGAEVAIGSLMISFLTQSQVFGIDAAHAARYVSLYWGGAMVGRLIGSAVLRVVRPGHVLGACALIAALLVVTAGFSSGAFAGFALIAIGLFNSIQFPTIFSLGIEQLGEETPEGSGLLCMAIVGGAIIPLIVGGLADRIGIGHALLLPALCYLWIAAYGIGTVKKT